MWQFIKPSPRNLRLWQVGLLVLIFVLWHVTTKPGLIPSIVFENELRGNGPSRIDFSRGHLSSAFR